MITVNPSNGFTMMTTGTTGNSGILYLGGQTSGLNVTVQTDGTISAGTIIIEEAFYRGGNLGSDPVYSGTWSQVSSISATGVGVTGSAQQTYHYQGSFWAIRARISSAITGGGTTTITGWGTF